MKNLLSYEIIITRGPMVVTLPLSARDRDDAEYLFMRLQDFCQEKIILELREHSISFDPGDAGTHRSTSTTLVRCTAGELPF